MLVIRKEQIDALQFSAYDEFADKMLPAARAAWKAKLEDRSDDEVKAQLRRAAAKSAAYDIHSYPHIMRVFSVFMVCGEGFDKESKHADIVAILERNIIPEKKIKKIDLVLSVQLTRE